QNLAKQMQLSPNFIEFRAQKTRWGSCSSTGTISLNWKLIATPLQVMDYVLIHELAHLKFQNHSKEFWNFVGQFCLGWKKYRRWLRENHFECDFLEPVSEIHAEKIRRIRSPIKNPP